jgi:hypothetical protein
MATSVIAPPDRFQAFTRCPAAARFLAMALPIAPSPMTPTSTALGLQRAATSAATTDAITPVTTAAST